MGDAYLNYSFTKGSEQEVAFLMKELDLKRGMKLLDVGCGPGRHSHLFAKAGITVLGIDISQEFIDIASKAQTPDASFLRLDAKNMHFDKEFDAVISLCQGAFGLAGETNKPVPVSDPDGEILKKMSQALVVGGKLALSAFSAYFQVHFLEDDKDMFFADHGVNHEQTTIRNASGDELTQDLWTSCFTPRELRLLAKDADLLVESIWSVTPGKYRKTPPTYTQAELLMIASRENYA
ncbi:methyltransferase [bacterium]|nr:methyltransferase [bacterium]